MTRKKASDAELSRRDMFARGAGLSLSLAMASAATASPAAAATPMKVFSVTDFGAVGDGKANDTAAFRRAVAAAVKAAGGVIDIPPGVYSVQDIWLGRKSNGKRPSIMGIHMRGAGIGATILKQRAIEGAMGGINMVDARHCSIRDLTVDSGALDVDGSNNGGVLLFGCQNCLVENVEVRNSAHRSFSVASHLFGEASLEARDTVVRGCIAWGQRVWNGNAAAQIIASDGAKETMFVDCISEAGGNWQGDLFGADDAPGTVFRGCRAYGNKTASAGFWVEELKGERPAFFTDCHVADTRNVGIGGEEGAERMFIQNCYFHRVGKNAIRAAGVGHLFVDGCFIEECGGDRETEDGAMLLQGDGSVQNTRFVNSTAKHAAVNLYTTEASSPRGFARFIGCTFDKPVSIYQNAAEHVAFDGCTFFEDATIQTYKSAKTSVAATMCLFVNQGLDLAGVARATVRDSTFRALGKYRGAAITGGTGSNPLTLSDCTFVDYQLVADGTFAIRAQDNRFENCKETLAAQSSRDAVYSAVLSLDGKDSQAIPGTAAGNSYVILVTAKGSSTEGAVFTVTRGATPRIGTLSGAPGGGSERAFALSIQDGVPALSYPAAVEAHVTVLRTELDA